MKSPIATAALLVTAMLAIAQPAVGAASDPTPTFPAHGDIVATRYSDANDGNGQIIRVGWHGEVRILTTGNQDDRPDVSPDGGSIAFLRCVAAVNCDDIGTVNVWVMRADGTHAHPLTACDGTKCLGADDPAYSPDGRYIAFTEDLLDAHGVNFQGVFVMRADGTGVRRVTSNGPDALPDGSPRFSPDGKHLVFTRESSIGTHLMVVGVDGTGMR